MKNFLMTAWITVIITGLLAFSFMTYSAEIRFIFSGLHRLALIAALALTIIKIVFLFTKKFFNINSLKSLGVTHTTLPNNELKRRTVK